MLSVPQWNFLTDLHRFVVVVGARRVGKTYGCIDKIAEIGALKGKNILYISPTYKMSKNLLWEPLKSLFYGLNWVKSKNEVDLSIVLKSGSKITLKGADNPDAMRGLGIDYAIFDEIADIRAETWTAVIRPALSVEKGKALFLGTPRGRNNILYEMYLKGQNPNEPEWSSYQFTTLEGGQVDEEEVEAARRELDEKTFNQEYNAKFENYGANVYYNFTDANKIQCRQLYNPNFDLIFCFDFNSSPGVAAIIMEHEMGSCVIGQVYIPQNSTTPAVCNRLIKDWGSHSGNIFCYGDATGAAKGSAKVAGSDWDLIKQSLRGHFGDRLKFRVNKSNPRERVRVNAVNSRIQTFDGNRHLYVDYSCKNVIYDFEGVQTLKGGSGEIDKKSNLNLSHISDAIGYYINKRFPVVSRKTKVRELMI